MSFITTILKRFRAPALPNAPETYERRYVDQLTNILRIYFNQLDQLLEAILASNPALVSLYGTALDAFGRARVSSPYTLFDSQNRYAVDPQFNTATTGTGVTTFLPNESSVSMAVTSGGVGSVIRQTYRVFPYQPGKGLLVLATFVMDSSTSATLTQRVGYFNTQNGVFLQRVGTTPSFVLRSYISGAASDARTVNQADWNGDKLDGTGDSGLTLDLSKAQILWMDFEWLGVGSVRCGFVINGQFITCHTFNNANQITSVYMTTAILPVRYEITSTVAVAAALKQICSSVVSEGGYEQVAADSVARRTTTVTGIGTSFVPLVSIRLNSSALGAVVLPTNLGVYPVAAGDYEIALIKNATLTGASYVTGTFQNVDYDVTATALTGGVIVKNDYASATNKAGAPIASGTGYNFDLQLGVSLAGVSDVYTLAARTLSGTGSATGSLSFLDLTA